jgi:hypothetical protein
LYAQTDGQAPVVAPMLPSSFHPPFQTASPRHPRRRASPADETVDEDTTAHKREFDDAALKDLKLSHINRFIMGMNMLNPQWANKDPQLAKRIEDQLTGLICNSNAPLPISSVARDMGVTLQHDQLIKVGATVARLYRDKHRTEPPKRHTQWGEERRINAYTEADRGLIVEALGQLMAEWASVSA